MLVIISDLHLTDGTCGQSISAAAFRLFVDRLKELVLRASYRADGSYRPIEEVDLILLGDILDIQHSTLWLKHKDKTENHARPWTDRKDPEFLRSLQEITTDILANNAEAASLLKSLTIPGAFLNLPPATRWGEPAKVAFRHVPVKVSIYYMVGNHDWVYHLPESDFDPIRRQVIEALGLSNRSGPFPHQAKESPEIDDLLKRHGVYAQHGDLYDNFNISEDKDRDKAALGDAFAVEIINKFPVRVEEEMKDELPPEMLTALRELVNVRPVLATPLWISSQLRRNNISEPLQRKIKSIWDELGKDFLELDFVREHDKKQLKPDMVDGLEALFGLTDVLSFKTLDSLVLWIRKRFWSDELTLSQHALKEEAFLNHRAQFIVYGHSHHHEVVPLDFIPDTKESISQMYMNSGTWHTYFDLAVHKPEEQKFIPYQVLTYLTFYKQDEHRGRRFETWSSSFTE